MTQRAETSAKMSAWVNANAGSGKTYVLISRLVSLMMSGASPDKLLCLTYTKSAAAEMQNRLFSLLSEWATMDDTRLRAAIQERLGIQVTRHEDLYQARTLFARALETPGGLKVQTIHAFCEALLHRFPLEAGLTPGFDLIDEADGRSLIAELASKIMAREDEDFIFLSRYFSEQDFTALIHRLVASRSRYNCLTGAALDSYLIDNFGPDARQQNDAERSQFITDFQKWVSSFRQAMQSHGSNSEQERAENLSEALAKNDPDEIWAGLRKFFETGRGEPRKNLYNKAFAKAAPDIAGDVDLRADAFYALEAQRRRQHARSMTAILHRAASLLQNEYTAAKLARNTLDYDDLIDRAGSLLSERSATAWVLYKIDNGLDHILIDEAQDTSPAQWHVVAALAEEFFAGSSARNTTRTIFAVGDEKQSIFSFQGADPTSFDRMREYFAGRVQAAEQGFEPVNMIKSYRSAPEILSLVDKLFSNPESASGLTAAGKATEHEPHREKAVGYVELFRPELNSGERQDDIWWQTDNAVVAKVPARQRMAERIATKIQSLVKAPGSDLQEGDILILVRRRNAVFYDLLRALHQTGVKIAGADRMKLLDELVIKDLINIAELALNPMNDLALAIFLRSPLGALSDPDLYNLAYGRSGSLWEALSNHVDQPPYDGPCADVTWLLANASLTPFDFFSHYLSGRGGQRRLKQRLGNEVDDAINEFLRLALQFERTNAATLQGFIHWIRSHATEIKREMDEGGDAVRIMTVHGAKGLEAPVVFLVDDCVAQGLAQRDRVIVSHNHLVWRPPTRDRAPEDDPRLVAAEKQAFAESQRLLYVALTRARDRLYIASYVTRGDTAAPTSWYGQLEACYPDTGQKDSVWSVGDETKASPERSSAIADTRILPRPGPDWIHQEVTQKPEVTAISPTRLARRQVLGRAPSEKRSMQFGTLVHNVLQFLPNLPETDRYSRLAEYLEKQAQGLASAQRETVLAQIRVLLEREDFAPLFSSQARAECAIRGRLQFTDGHETIIAGQVDRYYHNLDDDFVWVVDFKTGQRDATDDTYLRQMAIYRHLIAQATGASDIRCSLIWVNDATEERFSDQELDQAFTEIIANPLDRAGNAT